MRILGAFLLAAALGACGSDDAGSSATSSGGAGGAASTAATGGAGGAGGSPGMGGAGGGCHPPPGICGCGGLAFEPGSFDCATACEHGGQFCNNVTCVQYPSCTLGDCAMECEAGKMLDYDNAQYGCMASSTSCDEFAACVDEACSF